MDSLMILLYALGAFLLTFATLISRWALRGFRQSKQALREAASYVSVIVEALSSRIEHVEATAAQLQSRVDTSSHQNKSTQDVQVTMQLKFEALLKSIQDLTANDKRLTEDVEQLRLQLNRPQVRNARVETPSSEFKEESVVDRLTPTERQALNVLVAGPLAAPQIGKLLDKSREHTARLMKKLYLDGFVDRESDRSPFRYRLNDKLRSSISGPVTRPPSQDSETS